MCINIIYVLELLSVVIVEKPKIYWNLENIPRQHGKKIQKTQHESYNNRTLISDVIVRDDGQGD